MEALTRLGWNWIAPRSIQPSRQDHTDEEFIRRLTSGSASTAVKRSDLIDDTRLRGSFEPRLDRQREQL